ncbi:hypothetical protein LTS18_007231, partial [Coniosporium uncinatum]
SAANETVRQTSLSYTSTKSIFTIDVAGKVGMNITFLSPVTPNDFRRQSLVFSYMNVQVYSTDGSSHEVQLYADISAGEWAAGSRQAYASWEYSTTSTTASPSLAYHRIRKQLQEEYSEVNDQAEWGDFYWTTNNSDSLSWQSGSDRVVRESFIDVGVLPNEGDDDFRPIDQDYPVFGFARNLGSFNGSSGYKASPSLWRSYFDDDIAAMDFFYNDYETSSQISTDLDRKIESDSVDAAGQNYSIITTLSVQISSNGNMNTGDVISPFHPLLLYTNPELLMLLLKSLFENQEASNYPNQFSIHDIGAHYPNATGHPLGDDEAMPVEECGNMLIMILKYAQRMGNTTYLNQHYQILNKWTQFLISDALVPASQLSADDFAGHLANQTNLALKGIIGIAAMAQIANLTGHEADAANCTQTSNDYIEQWYTLGTSDLSDPPHTTFAYGQKDTHGLLYNLFADRELGLDLVVQDTYDQHSAFYPTVAEEFGMFAAAVADGGTRDVFIGKLAQWIDVTPTSLALTDLYDTGTGEYPEITFVARPVVGGTFALLLVLHGR